MTAEDRRRSSLGELLAQLAEPLESEPEWNEIEWAVARSAAAMQGISTLLKNKLVWFGPPAWQAFLAEQHDQVLRALADADNARKRAQTEATNAQKYALEKFANGLLPVVDGLEAAVKSADLSGVEHVLRQLVSALDKANIREINPAPGERFDPYQHQAMAAVARAR